jgi:hypothetical protein
MKTRATLVFLCFLIPASLGCRPQPKDDLAKAEASSNESESASAGSNSTSDSTADGAVGSPASTGDSASNEADIKMPPKDLPAQPDPTEPLEADDASIRILAWNIESDGANPDVIAEELLAMPRYDLYGFTEVRPIEWPAIKDALGDDYFFRYSKSGRDDRTAFAVRKDRFDMGEYFEIDEYEGAVINPGNYRSPFVFELTDKVSGKDFLIVLNHLARGKAEIRQQQCVAFCQWAKAQTKPVIAIGDYNLDYVFETKKGNEAFDIFMGANVFDWVQPVPLIDSNWYDGDGDGLDDYPGSILDFAFVAGDAKQWKPRSQVVVRAGDFPDDLKRSDHRPIELVLAP